MEMIVELYKQLTKILVRKAQQPDESSLDKWSLDDLEAFRCYREDISDTLVRFVPLKQIKIERSKIFVHLSTHTHAHKDVLQ